ncbi:hypothetical protein BE17_02365 [Sorangium cellulosum]|uniref:Uncharacterized protein n=1 Tax=Sorangium cellulosum TaxID=56 RepID=A0A150RW24_SORCE|nr:hypothetical protein BE17_02365 [Sorangium cellulosum]
MLGFADPYVILSDAARALPAQRRDAILLEGSLSFATFTRTAAALLGVAPPAQAMEGNDLTAPAAPP